MDMGGNGTQAGEWKKMVARISEEEKKNNRNELNLTNLYGNTYKET